VIILTKKDINNIGEIKGYFSKSFKALEIIVDIFSIFNICKTANKLNEYKKRGFSAINVFSILLFLPFIAVTSVRALFKSGYKSLSKAESEFGNFINTFL
jgi:hypothetical protein